MHIDPMHVLGVRMFVHVSCMCVPHRSYVCAWCSTGLTHNDLKPANLVLDINYYLRIIDLGSCRLLRYGGKVWCTLSFSAPESIKDDAKPTVVSDAYSVGAIGYFMITGGSYLFDYNKFRYAFKV